MTVVIPGYSMDRNDDVHAYIDSKDEDVIANIVDHLTNAREEICTFVRTGAGMNLQERGEKISDLFGVEVSLGCVYIVAEWYPKP